MTKPLHPEIKAMRALERATRPLDPYAAHRCLSWFVAWNADLAWATLPSFTDRRPEEKRADNPSAHGELLVR